MGGYTEGSQVRVQPECTLALNGTGLKKTKTEKDPVGFVSLVGSLSAMAVGGVYVYCGRTLSYACFYHSLGFLTLCFGLIARDFNAVGYITLTKQGNKTGKYLFGQVFTVQKGLGTSVPARVRGGQA